jgi:hypothetical protein
MIQKVFFQIFVVHLLFNKSLQFSISLSVHAVDNGTLQLISEREVEPIYLPLDLVKPHDLIWPIRMEKSCHVSEASSSSTCSFLPPSHEHAWNIIL